VIRLRVPPLRERREDIPLLAASFARAALGDDVPMPEKAMEVVFEKYRNHEWPGNVRELRNVVERMAILTPGERITADAIPLEVRSGPARAATGLQDVRQTAERERIRQVLDQTDWNVSAAARMLETERTALHKRIRALGLKRQN